MVLPKPEVSPKRKKESADEHIELMNALQSCTY